MSLQIICPLPAAIGDLGAVDCAVHFGQILRFAFGRVGGGSFATELTFATEVTWTTNLAAIDDTKVQFTPTFENFVIPAGEAATDGGDDNTTQFGQAILVGATNIAVTGRFRGLPFDVRTELQAYQSEASVYGNIGIFMVDEFGVLYGDQPGGVGTPVEPIIINSFFVGDPGTEGYNTHTFTMFQFNFAANWSDSVISVVPDFDPLLKPNS